MPAELGRDTARLGAELALFRGKLLAALDTALERGDVEMPGGEVADPEAWDHLRDRLHRMRWNVYAKRPFGGAEQVIPYLGRYTHRVGISNHRLVTMDDRGITFWTKDGETVTLSPGGAFEAGNKEAEGVQLTPTLATSRSASKTLRGRANEPGARPRSDGPHRRRTEK